MKFFTYQVWTALQAENSKIAERKWLLNMKAYKAQFNKVESCLSKRVFALFSRSVFHDGEVTGIHFTSPQKILLTLKNWDFEYVLMFGGVRAWYINFDTRHDCLSLGRMFEWGYDELTKLDDGFVKLEILFSSGGTCIIEFRKLQIKSNKKTSGLTFYREQRKLNSIDLKS